MLSQEQRDVLRLNFESQLPLTRQFGLDFYERLTEVDPAIEPPARETLDARAMELVNAITSGIVDLIGEGRISGAIVQLGVRLRTEGVMTRDYDTYGRVLLALFEERLGDAASPRKAARPGTKPGSCSRPRCRRPRWPRPAKRKRSSGAAGRALRVPRRAAVPGFVRGGSGVLRLNSREPAPNPQVAGSHRTLDCRENLLPRPHPPLSRVGTLGVRSQVVGPVSALSGCTFQSAPDPRHCQAQLMAISPFPRSSFTLAENAGEPAPFCGR